FYPTVFRRKHGYFIPLAMTNFNLLATKVNDIDDVIRIREMNHAQRFAFLRKLNPAKVMRLSMFYWQYDYLDLLDMRNTLMREFMKSADISELLTISNPKK